MSKTSSAGDITLTGRGEINRAPLKASPAGADVALLESAADLFAKRRATVASLAAGGPPAPHAASHKPGGGDEIAIPPTRNLWVDKNRTDTYTATGEESKPFKTIQAAVNAVAAVAVAGQDWGLLIYTGQYVENVVLESTGLHSLALVAVGGVVGIVPATGNALQSTASNGNLLKFRMFNIEFTRPIVITGPNGGACFADVWHQDCKFAAGATIALNCINNWSMMDCYVEDAISLTNVAWFYVDSARMNGAISMACDSALPIPSGGLPGYAFFNGVYAQGALTLTKGGTGTGVVVAVGSRINSSSGTITNPAGWTLQAYASHIRGNLVNAGTFQQRTSFVEGTLTNSGTWTLNQTAGQLRNDSTMSGTTVKDALDALATFQASAAAEQSTTDTAAHQALRLSLTPAAGTYEIIATCQLSHQDTAGHLHARIELDDATVLDACEDQLALTSYTDGHFRPTVLRAVAVLTAAAHTVDLDYWQETTGPARAIYLRQATITARRIA